MSDTIVAVEQERSAAIEWSAVIGGALVASALVFVLFSFGAAAGVATVSPYSWNNPSATTLTWLGAIWFCLVMIGSIMVGGYFAGRYRSAEDVASREERESRDGAHGLLVWALSLMIGTVLASYVVGATASGVSSAVGTAAQGVTATIDRLPRTLLRDAGQRVQNPAEELAKVLSMSALQGQITSEDRDYAVRIVAAEAKVTEEDARKRIDAAIETGQQALETARKATIALAFLVGAISVIAAGAAWWAAMAGGRLRDQRGGQGGP